MNQYFDRMKTLAENREFPKRIRFMLKDVIELRRDGWVPRKASSMEGPMPINQVCQKFSKFFEFFKCNGDFLKFIK